MHHTFPVLSNVLALGRKFVEAFPDRQQRVLVAGPRTSGSYFAPLLRAQRQTSSINCLAIPRRRKLLLTYRNTS